MILTPDNCYLEEKDLVVDFKPNLDTRIKFSWSGKKQLKWYRIENKEWMDFSLEDPGIPLLFLMNQKSTAIIKFLETVPADLIQKIKPFLPYQMSILQFACANQEARQLLDSHPLLLWIIVTETGKFLHWPKFRNDLIRMKRVEALKLTVGNETKAGLQFLKKFSSQTKFASDDLEIIKRALKDEWMIAFFKHRQRIHTLHLHVCHTHPFLLNTGFINDFFEIAEETQCQYMIETFELKERIQKFIKIGVKNEIHNVHELLLKCKSLQSFFRLSDFWFKKYDKQKYNAGLYRTVYQTPPVPGNADLLPIQSQKQLIRESEVMNHCAKNFHQRILWGELYFYQLVYPERCTVALKISDNGRRFSIWDVRLKHNKHPQKRTFRIIENFFNQAVNHKNRTIL